MILTQHTTMGYIKCRVDSAAHSECVLEANKVPGEAVVIISECTGVD